MNDLANKYLPFKKFDFSRLKNKYLIAFALFALWVLFFDQNNLIERYQMFREKKQLENDREYYVKEKEEAANRLRELKTNNDNLEKFAREQYLMKKGDEDVFIIVEE